MQRSIIRFIERCTLPSHLHMEIVLCRKNSNQKLIEIFVNKINNQPILELYHSTDRMDVESRFNSIEKHGIRFGHACNKGYGVYTANHGRYSTNWSCGNVIICHVLANEKTKRYKSEIFAPIWNSEYVTSEDSMILPLYFIKFNIIGDRTHKVEPGFVKHGKFGCSKCDVKNEYGIYNRCDCPYDSYDARDVVLYDVSIY